jgi:hypothetical protein
MAVTTSTPQIRIFLADEMLQMGLRMIGFDDSRQERVSRRTNVRRFGAYFGSSPLVCAVIWEDLLTTELEEARVESGVHPKYFFLAMHFLKRYPTEEGLAGSFKCCERTARRWAWYFGKKLQALQKIKVS